MSTGSQNGDSEKTPVAPAGASPSPRNKLGRSNTMRHLADDSLRQLHEQPPSPIHSTGTAGDAGVRGLTPITDRPELEKRVDELGSNLAAFDEKISRKMEDLENSLAKQGEMIKKLLTTVAHQHQGNAAASSAAP